MAEFLFHNDEGCLAINEEAVKALSNDFVSIMKGVYTDLSAKYDQTVNAILGREMVMDSAWTLTLERGQSVVGHTHKVNTQLYPLDYYSQSFYLLARSLNNN